MERIETGYSLRRLDWCGCNLQVLKGSNLKLAGLEQVRVAQNGKYDSTHVKIPAGNKFSVTSLDNDRLRWFPGQEALILCFLDCRRRFNREWLPPLPPCVHGTPYNTYMHEFGINIKPMPCLIWAAVAWAIITLANLMHLCYVAIFLRFTNACRSTTYITHVSGVSLFTLDSKLEWSDHTPKESGNLSIIHPKNAWCSNRIDEATRNISKTVFPMASGRTTSPTWCQEKNGWIDQRTGRCRLPFQFCCWACFTSINPHRAGWQWILLQGEALEESFTYMECHKSEDSVGGQASSKGSRSAYTCGDCNLARVGWVGSGCWWLEKQQIQWGGVSNGFLNLRW